jgi:hypothetical protein
MFGNWNSADLRDAAARHQELANKYKELADLLDQLQEAPGPRVTDERRRPDSKRTREVFDFLKKCGPSSAEEIHRGTEIPIATVYAVCKDQSHFYKKEGKWSVQQRT